MKTSRSGGRTKRDMWMAIWILLEVALKIVAYFSALVIFICLLTFVRCCFKRNEMKWNLLKLMKSISADCPPTYLYIPSPSSSPSPSPRNPYPEYHFHLLLCLIFIYFVFRILQREHKVLLWNCEFENWELGIGGGWWWWWLVWIGAAWLIDWLSILMRRVLA